jgi:ribosome-associated protein
MKSTNPAALEVAKLCTRVLDDKKAGGITVLDVSAQSSITDYLVIATATSEPHLRALRVELEKALDDAKVHLVGMEIAKESGWMVIDAFEVMVHLFLEATREHYGLERLWQDASALEVDELLGVAKPKSPRAKKKPAVTRAPKPKARRRKE